MTDEIKNETNFEGQPDQKVVMQIFITKEGKVRVSGMIDDKTIALGLLEVAKMELQEHWARLETKIVKPNGIMGFVRNGRH